jgi:hypothetical protein
MEVLLLVLDDIDDLVTLVWQRAQLLLETL